jgi:hypothetical protein
MNNDRIIPIEHGSPYETTEAYANLDTKEIEEGSWDAGPSNTFYASGGTIHSMPVTEEYRDGYENIDWHRDEEDDGKRDN